MRSAVEAIAVAGSSAVAGVAAEATAAGAATTAVAVRKSGLRCVRCCTRTSRGKSICADIVMLTIAVLVGVVLCMLIVLNQSVVAVGGIRSLGRSSHGWLNGLFFGKHGAWGVVNALYVGVGREYGRCSVSSRGLDEVAQLATTSRACISTRCTHGYHSKSL